MAGDVDPCAMGASPGAPDVDRWLPSVTDRLDRPVSAQWCVLGWLAATGLFIALIALFGGPTPDDAELSLTATWSIAHGQVACAYPPLDQPPTTRTAPLYPLLSGGIAALARIGDATPFPSASAVGPDCRRSESALTQWSRRSGALTPTLWIGCIGWIALMAGVIEWLRASGRGRCGWEPLTLVVAASLLPVWMSVQSSFHPQDLLALGLALSATACARRDRWAMAGCLCALAFLSQQYALLVAAPLFVLAPARKKAPFVGAALLGAAIVVVPLGVMTSGHAVHASLLGTGNDPLAGGTVLNQTHASGALGVLLYRIAPVAVSVGLAWWTLRRLGIAALESVPLLSLVAVSLGLRLVFESSLFTYYFTPLAVCLVLLDATRGTIRRSLVAWLGALTVITCRTAPLPFGTTRAGADVQSDVLPLLIGGLALVAILMHLRRVGDRRFPWPWAALALVTLFAVAPGSTFSPAHVVWFWQVVLTVPGLMLAAEPLWQRVRSSSPRATHCAEPAFTAGG